MPEIKNDMWFYESIDGFDGHVVFTCEAPDLQAAEPLVRRMAARVLKGKSEGGRYALPDWNVHA
jgi:hypothetical protein